MALLLEDQAYLEEAFSFAEQNKSILLADALKGNRARVLGDLPDSLAQKEKALQEQKEELRKNILNSRNSNSKNEFTQQAIQLDAEIDAFVNSIKDKYPKYHALKYENVIASAKDVQALLDEETILLEYAIFEESIFLFGITQNKVEAISLKPLKKRLTPKSDS